MIVSSGHIESGMSPENFVWYSQCNYLQSVSPLVMFIIFLSCSFILIAVEYIVSLALFMIQWAWYAVIFFVSGMKNNGSFKSIVAC